MRCYCFELRSNLRFCKGLVPLSLPTDTQKTVKIRGFPESPARVPPPMSYQQASIPVPENLAEPLSDALLDCGALSAAIEDALAGTDAEQPIFGEPEAVIIGGGEIYRQTLPPATDLRLTEIALTPAGDTYFPEFSRREWHETAREHHVSQNGIAFDFVHYERQSEQTGT